MVEINRSRSDEAETVHVAMNLTDLSAYPVEE